MKSPSQAPGATPPTDIAAPAEGGEAPSYWEISPEPPVVRYFHGPEAAVLEEAPPANPEAPEPDETVGEALTERQLSFCERYVECPVARRAAREAGYAESTADKQASRLLKHPLIMRRILELRRKRQLEAAYRRETLLDKFDAVFAEAIERREFYAAIQALTMQARLARIQEAMPGFRYMHRHPNMGEQLIWDAVNHLEQKLCEITLGDFPGAGATHIPPAGPSTPAAPMPPSTAPAPRSARRRR